MARKNKIKFRSNVKYTKETKVTDMSSKLAFIKKKWELIMSNNGVFKQKNHDIFSFDVN